MGSVHVAWCAEGVEHGGACAVLSHLELLNLLRGHLGKRLFQLLNELVFFVAVSNQFDVELVLHSQELVWLGRVEAVCIDELPEQLPHL